MGDGFENHSEPNLDPTQVLTGERSASVNTFASGSISLTIDSSGGDNALLATIADTSRFGFEVSYGDEFGMMLPGGLAAGGRDRFVVNFAEAPASGGTLVARLETGVGGSSFSQAFSESISISGPGQYEILYSDIELEFGGAYDVGSASQVSFSVSGTAVGGDATYRIGEIVAVPEPSVSVLCMLAGIFCLGRRSRG